MTDATLTVSGGIVQQAVAEPSTTGLAPIPGGKWVAVDIFFSFPQIIFLW
jgi:hypothetical protein